MVKILDWNSWWMTFFVPLWFFSLPSQRQHPRCWVDSLGTAHKGRRNLGYPGMLKPRISPHLWLSHAPVWFLLICAGLRSGSRHLMLIILCNAVLIPWQSLAVSWLLGVQKCGLKVTVVKLLTGWEMWTVLCFIRGGTGSVGCLTRARLCREEVGAGAEGGGRMLLHLAMAASGSAQVHQVTSHYACLKLR